MAKKINIDLINVQRTLFMPVWARAIETKKKKPVLIDETAVKIIDSVDFDFSQMSKNVPEISQISWVARCLRFDLIVREFLKANPHGTIVNIGCGLDTSFERINNQEIQWYDLDLPEVIRLKKIFIKETANRRYISTSFLDTKWFDDILIRDKVIFISTGVFVYFDEDEIKDFLIKVAGRFNNSELFFDITSPKGVEIANQVIEKSGLDSNSFFKWGLANKSVITSWDNRINLLDTYYTFKIDGLELSPENKHIGTISDSLDIQYMVHLKISK